jgi:hypothetical protein
MVKGRLMEQVLYSSEKFESSKSNPKAKNYKMQLRL